MNALDLQVMELSLDEMTGIDGGVDGYEAGLAVGRFLRRVGEAIGEALSNYENPKYNGTWQG